MAHICNSATQEVEAAGPEAESQPQLHSESEASILHEHLSQNKGVGLRREPQEQVSGECWCRHFLLLAGTMLGLHNTDPNIWAAPHEQQACESHPLCETWISWSP